MKHIILVIFAACFVQALSKTREKPSSPAPLSTTRCPKPIYTPRQCATMSFQFMCNVDSDCSTGQKCCSNGCVLQCLPNRKISGNIVKETEVVKPNGTCPAPIYTPKQCQLIRFISCSSDANCTTGQKCCNNGCGMQCMTAGNTCTKRGVCPSGNINCIWSMCKSDCDCPGTQKCCYGCMCTEPANNSG